MIDFTQSPEFMDGLRHALAVAVQGVVPPGASAPAVGTLEDPDNVWLTTQQTLKFLELSSSAFHRFRQRLKEEGTAWKLCVSYTLGATEPRYQLASLRALMAEGSVGGGQPDASKITSLPRSSEAVKGRKAA